jgi:hypothetical protein
MKKTTLFLCALMLVAFTALWAEKYAGEIFQMGAGVRSYAMGGSGVSDADGYALAYWNAALLNEVKDSRYEVMHAEEYSGLLTYDTFAAVWGEKTKMSVVLTRISIDDIPLTKLADPTQDPSYNNRPYKYKNVNNADMVLYFGMARKIGNYVLGITPKLAYRDLADEAGYGFGADLSTYFDPAENWRIGLRLRDVFTTQIIWSNDTVESVNPGLDAEVRNTLLLPGLNRQASWYVGVESYSEGRDEAATTALGPISLDYHAGVAVDVHQRVTLLAGYDVENLTAGLRLGFKQFDVNYAFEHSAELENSHRVSVGLRL